MSKFNFLAGGYYGKLGQTVGQRWKNKRTLRSYVIPKNPRTDAQQKNRADFAGATRASQLAMQLNAGASFWQTADNTEFNNRMSSARKYYLEGMDLVQFTPAIPYGYVATHEISATIQKLGQTLTYYCSSTDNLDGRSMSVLLEIINDDTQKKEYVVLQATITGSSGAWSFTVTVPTGYSVTGECYTLAVSNDDSSYNNETVYLYPTLAASAKPTVNVTITGGTFGMSAGGYVFIPTYDVADVPEIPADFEYTYEQYAVFDLKYQTRQITETVIQSYAGDYCFGMEERAYSVLRRMLATGSTYRLLDFQIETDDAIYNFTMPNAVNCERVGGYYMLFNGVTGVKNGNMTVYDAGETDLSIASNVVAVSLKSVDETGEVKDISVDCQVKTMDGHLCFVINTGGTDIVYGSEQTVTVPEVMYDNSYTVVIGVNRNTTWTVFATSNTVTLTSMSGTYIVNADGLKSLKLNISCSQDYWQWWYDETSTQIDSGACNLRRNGRAYGYLDGSYFDYADGAIQVFGDEWLRDSDGMGFTPQSGDVIVIPKYDYNFYLPVGTAYLEFDIADTGVKGRVYGNNDGIWQAEEAISVTIP